MKSLNDTVASLHADTPEVIVHGSAGTSVLSLRFLRHPDAPTAPARILKSRIMASVPERTSRQYGSRPLKDDAGHLQPDAVTVKAISGQSIMLHTADGDAVYALADAAGRPLWSRSAQGTVNTFNYEGAVNGGRPLTVSEQPEGGHARVREQFTWGPVDEDHQARNLAGALITHYDNAGYSNTLSLALTGQPRETRLRLLSHRVDLPDWGADVPPDIEVPLAVSDTYDATGAPLTQANAAGGILFTTYDVSGAVGETRARYMEKNAVKEVVVFSNIVRDAAGIVLSQIAGSGVLETYEYDPQTRYLTRHAVTREKLIISDLHYAYDPSGNILSLNEVATDVRWHRNRITDGERLYAYDTLYRLASATGRERLADTARGPQTRLKADGTGHGGAWFPYAESYAYDDGDNLIQIIHTGNTPWTRTLAVSASSNRALLNDHALTPDTGFLPGGLQTHLADGRKLEWYADGQLRQVTPVNRKDDVNDVETYCYAGGGTRVRKVRLTKAAGGIQTSVTTYAGGCETRRRTLDNSVQMDVCVTEAGGVRVIHNVLKNEIHLRYGFSDHLGSVSGETDEAGNITSREEYYPYGGSAGADEEAAEIKDRTRRYSGKERDATGIMYYGWRYYQPETGRWLSADPGGLIDGVNLFRFCRNNPANIIDTDGRGCNSSKAVAKADARDEMEAKKAEVAVSTEISLEDRKKEAVKQLSAIFTAHAYYDDDSNDLQWIDNMDMNSFSAVALKSLGNSGFSPEDANDILKKSVRRGNKILNKELIREKLKARREQIRLEKKELADVTRLAMETKRKQESLFAVWAHDSPGIQKGGERRFDARKVKDALREKMDEGVVGKRSWSATTGADTIYDINNLDGYSYAEIAQKLDVAIDKKRKTETSVLYRGVDMSEFSRWKNSGQGSIFSPGRFTSFSGSENVAETFGGAGIVELEAGASGGARVGLWYSGVHENEILFRRDARFQIKSISGNRIKARFQ